MSGGHFDYNQYKIDQIACDIEQMIIDNDSTELNEFGYTKGYNFSPETIEKFKEGLDILKLAYVYAQRIDWLVSGDDNEDSFHSRLNEELKKLKKLDKEAKQQEDMVSKLLEENQRLLVSFSQFENQQPLMWMDSKDFALLQRNGTIDCDIKQNKENTDDIPLYTTPGAVKSN